jgi:hypothetical protein
LEEDEFSGLGKLGEGSPRLEGEFGSVEPPLPAAEPAPDEPGPKPRFPAHPQSTTTLQMTAMTVTRMAAPL